MRVLHVRASGGFHGPEQGLLRLGVALGRLGVTMKIIVYARPQPDRPDLSWLVDDARRNGLAADAWVDRAKLSWADVRRLGDELVRGGHDLLVTHDPKSDLLGYLATRRAPVPWIAVVHGYDLSVPRNRLYRRIDLWLLRRARRAVAVSQSLADELVTAGVPRSRVTIVPNGIDIDQFTEAAWERAPTWRTRLESGGGPLIVSVGRLDRQKGFTDLIRAAAAVTRVVPTARVWIVGEGRERSRLARQIRSLGLAEVVHLLGHQRDIAGIMAAADLVVLASRWEPFGNVLLEAAALGQPVVGTRVGGIPEIVRDRETGRLVAPGDPDGLAEAILGLLANPGEAARQGEDGRAHVAREFSSDRFAREMIAVYREALGPGGRTPVAGGTPDG